MIIAGGFITHVEYVEELLGGGWLKGLGGQSSRVVVLT